VASATPAGPAALPEKGGPHRPRRLAWVREQPGDDSFLVFMGVVLAVTILGLIGYKVYKELNQKPAQAPAAMPLADLFNATRAVEGPPGRITVGYDFALISNSTDLREACPQMNDWQVPGGLVSSVGSGGKVTNSGVLVNGKYSRYIPYFTPGDLSLECDAALLQGSDLALCLGCIEEGRLDDGYRFEVYASPAGGGPAGAAIVEYLKGNQGRSSPVAKLPEVRARRNPPLFYRLKFELSAGVLRGYFQGQEVCQLPVGEMLPGSILLLGPNSRTAFDNVTIVGRPHPDFVKFRTDVYRLFRPSAAAPKPGPGSKPGTQPEPEPQPQPKTKAEPETKPEPAAKPPAGE
jgi:hypothetical protein